jgi:hypothetical protein
MPMVCAMRISHVTARGALRRARGRLTDEAGSFLIEALVSSVLVLITGAGILKMMDRGTQLSGQQKSLATAGNLAQSEQETLRAYPQSKEGMAILSNLRRVAPPRTVGGATYTITSRTDWINDASGESECATAAAPADYMKLTTTVTSPALGNRPPVVLESLITPPTRSFDENQGSLAVQVNDRNGDPISGLALSLTGPATMSETTNANGCVLWGYIAAGSGYTVSASRSGYVEPDGTANIAEPASVIGDQTANVDLQYDIAGGIRAAFTAKRPRTSTVVNSAPQQAMVEHSNAKFIARAFPVAASSLDSGLVLFPFTSPYTIYGGSCAAARPPVANLGSAVAPPGATSAIATVALPVVDRLIKYGATNVTSGTMKATSPCGSPVFTRSITSGVINDPGFPYGNLTNVCFSGTIGGTTRKQVIGTVPNTTFTYTGGSPPVVDVNGTGSTSGACP